MTITATPRTATGARPDLSVQFHIDHAKRLVRLADAGLKVNAEELRKARALLRSIEEAA